MTGPVLLSVVVPAFNEEGNIAPLVDEVTAALRGRVDFEIVCIDDGSTDGTLAALRALLPRVPELRVFQHLYRTGKSFALHSGVTAAAGEWIGTLDGDRQNDPADLPPLLDLARAGGPDLALVAGIRQRRRDTLAKRIGSRIGNGVRQFFLRDGCRDTGCGIKVIRREVFLALPVFEALHRFIPALVLSQGWQVQYAPVTDRPRAWGVSKYSNLQRALVGIVDLFGVAWLRARARTARTREVGR